MRKPKGACFAREERCFRGQAALEYLVTYGWAIFILIVIIGIILATGIFSPANFMSDECNFQPDFPCSTFVLYNDETVTPTQTVVLFNATNGFGFPIKITGFGATVAEGWPAPTATLMPSAGTVIRQGEPMGFSAKFTPPTIPSQGTVRTVYANLTFVNCYLDTATCSDPSLPTHTISGRITARVLTKG
ncbi:hypothetical protein FJZ26_04670 [Candidatus Parvarchaeota archaeon]|nr:hypothetical protein [Candidatus Parvarchaeota archaeon]